MTNDEHLHRAFSFFDKNKSGFIEVDELRDALNDDVDSSSEEVISAIMHDVDTDKVSPMFSILYSVSFIVNVGRRLLLLVLLHS